MVSAPTTAACSSARPLFAGRTARLVGRTSGPAWGAIAVGVIMTAICVWWAAVDRSFLEGDPHKHFFIAIDGYDQVRSGDWLGPYKTARLPDYGPIVHYVMIASWLIAGGPTVGSALIAIALVFVPLLVLGSYKAGAALAGPRVGLLATLFVAGSPIVVSQLHVTMVDVPMTAMLAVTVWLLIASRRFQLRRYAVAAGVAAAIGFLVKDTILIYLLGFVIVMVVRGGWRRPGNVGLSLLVFLIGGLPWFVVHYGAQHELLRGAGTIANGTAADRAVWTVENFAWFGWAMLNFQLLLPLFALFILGLGIVVARAVRRRPLPPYSLELLAGGVLSYVVVAIFLSQDMRYTMPALIFVALISLGWTAQAGRRAQLAVGGVVAVAFVVNTLAVNLGLGQRQAFRLAGSNGAGVLERQIVWYSPDGYAGINNPDRRYDYLGLLRDLHADGARKLAIEPASIDTPQFPVGVTFTLARGMGYSFPAGVRDLGPRDAQLVAHIPIPREPRPCMMLPDGRGVWVVRGARGAFSCPPGWEYPQ